jgi:bifunctional non-homologous end joining protein LigD
MPAGSVAVEVEGRHLSLSNLDKVLYPVPGFTKGEVIDYYTRIAPVLLPHLRDRPLTLKRYPNGVDAGHFFEKNCPKHRPPWVETEPVYSRRNEADVEYCLCQDLPTLIWVANLASLELHTSLSRAGAPQRPSFLVFDLDPGAPADIVDCCRVGLRVRALFEELGLLAFPKTSGSKGLQVYVPLNYDVTYEVTKTFALTVAQKLEQDDPAGVTSNMSKAVRGGRVFVDWSQNDDHKTTICVYSLRAREQPTVSTPVTWEEVQACAERGRAAELRFTHDQTLARVERSGDLFAPVLQLQQRIG